LRRIILIILVVAMLAGGSAWYFTQNNAENGKGLVLYGNVDIRQAQLAFNGSGRIEKMLVREGSPVKKGQLLAQLDASTLQEQERKAKAEVRAAQISADNADRTYRRTKQLIEQHFISQQQADNALAASDAAKAALQVAQATLRVVRKALDDTSLYAPESGIIQQRILETGDMASSQRPVYTLALGEPLWVRAYVQETDLGKVKPGMPAEVGTDSYPGKSYQAWIGYISPTAEFTPKSVETTEVRSSLVYQLRVFVCDAQGELRLGMPATIHIDTTQPPLADDARCNHT